MSREATLRSHLRSLEILDDAVLAMKSLSAHHFRLARKALASARSYRVALEAALSAVPPIARAPSTGPPLMLVVGADLGLCAQYHARLVEAARAHAGQLGVHTVDCIGRRTGSLLARAGLTPRTIFDAPSSVESATRVLLDVVVHVFERYRDEEASSVNVLSARFEGVGAFEPVRTRLLPLEQHEDGGPPPSPYVTRARLGEIAERERLFIALHELLLDAMASEHGLRLVATNAAGEWLDHELERTRRQLGSLRREASTQEILELVSGARRRGPRIAPGRLT